MIVSRQTPFSSWILLLVVVVLASLLLERHDASASAFVPSITSWESYRGTTCTFTRTHFDDHWTRTRKTTSSISLTSSSYTSTTTSQRSTSTALYGSVKTRIKSALNVPSGEAARRFRRTVYTHDDWVKHRNQNRFVVYLAAMSKSGNYKNMCQEILLTTAIAAFAVWYNAVVGGYTGLFEGVSYPPLISSGFFQPLRLPLSLFTLTSPALGLLLVFRTNTSYQRWDEARKNWGMNINHTRDLMRMANCYYDSSTSTGGGVSEEQRQDDLRHVALCTWAFCRAMKRHLSPEEEDEADFRKELYETLPRQQADMIINAAHRPNRALQDLSYAIDDLPMHFLRKNQIHKAVTILEDNLGSSERILTSPVPLFYSRHLARFLAVWLWLLPFGMYNLFGYTWNHIALIPSSSVIALMLFGIEELGTQLAEPFGVLPMQVFCDKIYNWCMEISQWQPGDNGRAMPAAKEEHAFFAPGPPPSSVVEVSNESLADQGQQQQQQQQQRKYSHLSQKLRLHHSSPEIKVQEGGSGGETADDLASFRTDQQ